ncbi:hypothetical protein OEZ86_000224 [Tetradesmus obliquus]|nr:hypothetical protein OEZ86_000224 [Tetradesmus obliquus]
MTEQQQTQEHLLQPWQQQQQQQQLQQAPGLHGVAADALSLLEQELSSHQPCVAKASIILGILQEWLFNGADEGQPLDVAVAQHVAKFQEQLVAPAAAKLGPKCKSPQDKVVALAKFLRGKLAKAPAHKQPLHTQYLPSALRDQGKRQLDCLGIATAVLGMCHSIAAQHSTQHADLAAARMMVSDDHCWLALPQQQQQQQQAGHVAASSSGAEDVQQLIHVEVTDPRPLKHADTANWLYAGGSGCTPCSSQQVILILVAGLMPEELKDEAAAAQLAAVQAALLGRLADMYPAALFYSNFFRWGMLHEWDELQELVAAAEAGRTAAFTSAARAEAAGQAVTAQLLHSSRVRALGEDGGAAAAAWHEMGLDLQQLLQMPSNRKRKRKEL